MLLPLHIDGSQREIDDKRRRIVIIGANGAGKTRFSTAFRQLVGPRAFRLSALEALYGSSSLEKQQADGGFADTINALYATASRQPAFLHNNPHTPFERLMTLLLNEEIASLVSSKVHRAQGEIVEVEPSKLDAVIERWQEIFPDNQVLRQGGQLLFAKHPTPVADAVARMDVPSARCNIPTKAVSSAQGDEMEVPSAEEKSEMPQQPAEGKSLHTVQANDTYSQLRLSEGEKAVLYYFGAVLYAPQNGMVFVDNPGMFLHPTITTRLWDAVEATRPDCTFVYTTHEVDFAATRTGSSVVWVRAFDAANLAYDYDLLPPNASGSLPEGVYLAILGARRPVLFIEGDATHSIDAKLYSLVFRDFTVKALGSCNKVIESTRSFNDLKAFHHLASYGIVDRDRREEGEVEYLRSRQIFVPEVAEVENILLLEGVVRAVASYQHKDSDKVFRAVRNAIVAMFRRDARKQALMHTRHHVKRTVEYRIDGRFNNINALEQHMEELVKEINPRGTYERLCRDFARYANSGDYAAILRVYNEKTMLPGSNVAGLCGITNGKEGYVNTILRILRSSAPQASQIRRAIVQCFTLPLPDNA